jgi:hypothetical protein
MRTIRCAHILRFAAAAAFAVAASASAQGLGIIAGVPVGSVPQPATGGYNAPAVHESGGFTLGLSAESGGSIGGGLNVLYVEHDVASGPANSSHRSSSLDVPVYLKLTFRARGASPFVLVGPQASFVLSCSNACPASQDLMMSAVVGAGVSVGTARRVSFQVRYATGFTSQDTGFLTNPGGIAEPATSFKSRSLQLVLGVGL